METSLKRIGRNDGKCIESSIQSARRKDLGWHLDDEGMLKSIQMINTLLIV